jgi:hypothetical protein
MGIIVRNEIVSPVTGQVLPEAYLSFGKYPLFIHDKPGGGYTVSYTLCTWPKKKAFDDNRSSIETTRHELSLSSDDAMVQLVLQKLETTMTTKYPDIDMADLTLSDGTVFRSVTNGMKCVFDKYNELVTISIPQSQIKDGESKELLPIPITLLYSEPALQTFIGGIYGPLIAGYTDTEYIEEI